MVLYSTPSGTLVRRIHHNIIRIHHGGGSTALYSEPASRFLIMCGTAQSKLLNCPFDSFNDWLDDEARWIIETGVFAVA